MLGLISLSLCLEIPARGSRAKSVQALPADAVKSSTPHMRFCWSRQAQQDKEGFYYQPAGLCDDYPEESRTLAKIRRDLQAVRQTGAKLLRCGVSWDTIEAQPGQYHWKFWDELVDKANRADVTLIPYVCYTPQWLAQNPADFWREPPKDSAKFGEFMGRIARRYRGKVHSWELWNEPDNPAFWQGTTAQFARLAIAGAKAVRQADPNAVIVLGGMAGGRGPFIEELLSRYGVGPYIDVFNMHGYYETWNNTRAEWYPHYIDAMADFIRAQGNGQDLWMAEFGYSNFRAAGTTVQDGGLDVFYPYEHTRDYQATELFKHHVLALSAGKLSLTAWYRINDLRPSTRVIGDDNNKFLGILDLQGRPKPAFYALKFVNTLFGLPVRLLEKGVQITAPTQSQSVVIVFEKKNGDLVVTGWLRSSVRSEVADTSGQAADMRRETLTVALPGRKFTRMTVYDALGNPKPEEATLQNGIIKNIVLTGDRIFIAELK